jgi:hypothetical protein
MFLFCFTVLCANALRLGWIEPRRQAALYLGGVAGMSALVPPLFEAGIPIQGLVLLLVLAMVGQEIALLRRDGPRPAHRFWWIALALMAAASACSALDLSRSWCDPDDHWLQGHALWHLLTAASLYALFRFYQALGLDAPAAQRVS